MAQANKEAARSSELPVQRFLADMPVPEIVEGVPPLPALPHNS